MVIFQGEALRQSLLTRYYGKTHPRMRRESAGAGPSSQTTGPGGGAPGSGGAGPGSVMLSRAEMTLAEVQVSLFPFCFSSLYFAFKSSKQAWLCCAHILTAITIRLLLVTYFQ